jgi:very-short-patch-repair endonuclease
LKVTIPKGASPTIRGFAQELRAKQTLAELKLGAALSAALVGQPYTLLAQHMIYGYILDFWIPESRLAIELDGKHHSGAAQSCKDAGRDRMLRSQHIQVYRIPNEEVFADCDALAQRIIGMADGRARYLHRRAQESRRRNGIKI